MPTNGRNEWHPELNAIIPKYIGLWQWQHHSGRLKHCRLTEEEFHSIKVAVDKCYSSNANYAATTHVNVSRQVEDSSTDTRNRLQLQRFQFKYVVDRLKVIQQNLRGTPEEIAAIHNAIDNIYITRARWQDWWRVGTNDLKWIVVLSDSHVSTFRITGPPQGAQRNEAGSDLIQDAEQYAGACGPDSEQLLRSAIRDNDIPLVKRLLVGVAGDATFIGEMPLLHLASRQISDGILLALLNHGADVNAKDSSGNTALHLACSFGSYKNSMCLLRNGANIHAKNNDGYTPVQLASRGGHDALGWSLVRDYNADVNQKFRDGNTFLHDNCRLLAGLRNSRLLLSKGADKRVQNNAGQTPLHCACSRSLFPTVELLLTNESSGELVNVTDVNGKTPFHDACHGRGNGFGNGGNLDIAKLLLHMGANAFAKDNSGKTPLDYACQNGHLDVVALIIRQNPANIIPSAEM